MQYQVPTTNYAFMDSITSRKSCLGIPNFSLDTFRRQKHCRLDIIHYRLDCFLDQMSLFCFLHEHTWVELFYSFTQPPSEARG